MPITLLFYSIVFLVICLLIVNIAYPLINPYFKMFWMFRKDRYKKTYSVLIDTHMDNEIANVVDEIKQVKKKKHNPKKENTK